MQLENMIFHKIQRDTTDSAIDQELASTGQDVTSATLLAFATEVKTRFASASNTYANIRKEVLDSNGDVMVGNSQMQERLEQFFNPQNLCGEMITFPDFTKQCALVIKSEIESSRFAKGGYIVFSKYTESGFTYLLILIMNMKKGFSYKSGSLTTSEIFNMENFVEGARINLNTWAGLNPAADRCMNFIKRRGDDDASKYFREALGCIDYAESKRNTGLAIDAIDAYLAHKSQVGSYDAETVSRKREAALEYLWDKAESGALVKFRELCEVLSPVDNNANDPEMYTYCQGTSVPPSLQMINEEFEVSKDKLKQRMRVSAKIGESSFTVAQADLQSERVLVDRDRGTLTFTGLSAKEIRKLERLR